MRRSLVMPIPILTLPAGRGSIVSILEVLTQHADNFYAGAPG
jgi:hypothetical protein